MASPSIQAAGHRARQALRSYCWPAETKEGRVLTNPCDWLHDTVVTNRQEKRRALALAKKYSCHEEKTPDDERGTSTTWVHGRKCPLWKAEEKKLPETPAGRLALVQAATHVPVEDENGNKVGETSLLTQEEARDILAGEAAV